MIMARITLPDGDVVDLPFGTWPELSAWMDANIGRFLSVDADQLPGGDEDPAATTND